MEAVAFTDLGPFFVGLLLMLLIVAMVGVEDVGKLSDLVLCMHSLDVDLVELGVLELVLHILQFLARAMIERMEEFLGEAALPRIAICSGHGVWAVRRDLHTQRQRGDG